MSLGQRIVKLRQIKNWKQGELAQKLGVTQRQLLRWEKDEVRPRPGAIQELARTFEVSIEELTSEAPPSGALRLQDEELVELLGYVPQLEPGRLDTLKNVLRDMITCQQIARLTNRKAAS